MADSSYNRQHLALHAAGQIDAAGSNPFGFGCQMTRLDLGHYALLLDANAGVPEGQAFTQVQVRGTAGRFPSVIDTSNTIKTIFTFDEGGTPEDVDIEVALFKAVTR